MLAALVLLAASSMPVDTGIATALPGCDQYGLCEKLHVLGWSSDGALAYVLEPPDEACGCWFGTFVVQDLKTDRVLHETKYSSEHDARYQDLTAWWKYEEKQVAGVLAKRKIVRATTATLEKFPAGSVTATLDITRGDAPDWDLRDIPVAARLELVSPDGRKQVWRDAWPEFPPYEVAVVGYLRSPHEKRIAVVVARSVRGWEGPPNPTRLTIVGALLEKGFR